MAKLMFLVIGGAGLVLLIAYSANAEFNVLQGRTISEAQQEGIAALAVGAVLVGCALKGWLDYRYRQATDETWRDVFRK